MLENGVWFDFCSHRWADGLEVWGTPTETARRRARKTRPWLSSGNGRSGPDATDGMIVGWTGSSIRSAGVGCRSASPGWA